MRKFNLFIVAGLFLILYSCKTKNNSNQGIDKVLWPEVKTVHKPGTYWWWMGSAVDKENLSYSLQSFAEIGIGNVHIVPIYGVDGEEDKYIDFLSPEWMEMLAYTVDEANKLNINVDMSTTTGWPFGGSHVSHKYAASKLKFDKISISLNSSFKQQIDTTNIEAIIALSYDQQVVDLTQIIDNNGLLNWTPPKGEWDIYIVRYIGTKQKVKRAAPGNEGLVLNPFSTDGLKYYLKRYDSAFSNYRSLNLRAQYHDSYEYYRANWIPNFFNEFEKRNGYDLKLQLPYLIDTLKMNPRITADFRRTLADLHLKYIEQWSTWSHNKGWKTRNQAHGAPGNLLDLYAAADIPETEMFGSRPYKIPGIRFKTEDNSKMEAPNPLIMKFASSAAHVTGKNLIASETGTWLRNHFKSSLSQAKPAIDELLYSGINHIFYHGNAYSPKDAEWPGWMYYASTHFEKENNLWKNFNDFNAYVTRCQSILQSGKPANDILLYWPVEDIYHDFPDSERFYKSMEVHKIKWFEESEFGKLATILAKEGYSFDYISDKQLQHVDVKNKDLTTNGNKYKTILIPITKYMPLKTWANLNQLASDGATIIFQNHLPNDVPGFNNLDKRRAEIKSFKLSLHFKNNTETKIKEAQIGKGKILVSDQVDKALHLHGIQKEQVVNQDILLIKRTHDNGFYYFLSNFSDKKLEQWVTLATTFESAAILDPRFQNKIGKAAVRNKNGETEIYLQLQSGESCFVKTFNKENIHIEKWNYLEAEQEPISLTGKWDVDFIEGGPEIPESFSTKKLESWTVLGDIKAQSFAGTGKYTLKFKQSDLVADDWILDLGKVCESARIHLNGDYVGTLWSFPYNIPVGKYLKRGENIIEIEVTNLSANRLRSLDKEGVDWQKFLFIDAYAKEFDASSWSLMESGLIGPVTLTPQKIISRK